MAKTILKELNNYLTLENKNNIDSLDI